MNAPRPRREHAADDRERLLADVNVVGLAAERITDATVTVGVAPAITDSDQGGQGATGELMQRLLDPEHNFSGSTQRRSGDGVRQLAETEEACRRVLALERVSYKNVERLLRTGLDRAPAPAARPVEVPAIEHDQVRGADFFADDESNENNEEDQDAA